MERKMDIDSECDVAIVGASIAGCTAAILFARKGAKVALIERDTDPNAYKKLCTHFIQASATPMIQRLGLAEPIEAAGGIRNDVEIYTRWGRIVAPREQVIKRPAYGYSIRRETLDPLLRKIAIETPGVNYMPGFSAHELLVSKNRIAGVAIQGAGGETRQIKAALVVGADGRQSRIAELAGLAAKQKPNGRIGYFAHYRDLRLQCGDRAQMWFLEPDIAYTFPNDDGVTLATAMPGHAKLAEWKSDPEAAMVRLFQTLPGGPHLSEAKRVSPMLGVIHYPNLIRKPVRQGLALVGDAAQSLDPLWGVGCGWAFQSAEWLADCVGDSCKGADTAQLDRNLTAYAKRHKSELAGHEFLISDFSTGRDYNFIERLMFSAAARDPVCADHFLAFGTRCIGVGAFLSPKAIARAAWVNARDALDAGKNRPKPAPVN
jgi:flavin-dependent dehydrogenase